VRILFRLTKSILKVNKSDRLDGTVTGTGRSVKGGASFRGTYSKKVMPKAVAGLRSLLPLMARGGPEVKCDSLLGAGDQYRCNSSDLGESRVLCGSQL
jgi:hypothetical protein